MLGNQENRGNEGENHAHLHIIVSSPLSFCMSDAELFLYNFNLECKFEGIFNHASISGGCCSKFLYSQLKSSISDSKRF